MKLKQRERKHQTSNTTTPSPPSPLPSPNQWKILLKKTIFWPTIRWTRSEPQIVDQRRLQERGVWARPNLGQRWVNDSGKTINLTMATEIKGLQLGIWERKAERRNVRWVRETEMYFWKPVLFLFKFLTSRVGFYGLVNVESEPEPKNQINTLIDPHPTRLGLQIRPWVFRSDGWVRLTGWTALR